MLAENTRRLPPEKRALIIAALEDNPNAGAVARKLGCHHITVEKIANEAGIDLIHGRAKGGLSMEAQARIFAELKATPNAKAVARKLGYHHTTVGKIAKQEGIALTAGRGRPAKRNRLAKQPARPTGHDP